MNCFCFLGKRKGENTFKKFVLDKMGSIYNHEIILKPVVWVLEVGGGNPGHAIHFGK